MSRPDPAATPDSRSLTDLWRCVKAAAVACPADQFDQLPAEYEVYLAAAEQFHQRLSQAAGWVAEGRAR